MGLRWLGGRKGKERRNIPSTDIGQTEVKYLKFDFMLFLTRTGPGAQSSIKIRSQDDIWVELPRAQLSAVTRVSYPPTYLPNWDSHGSINSFSPRFPLPSPSTFRNTALKSRESQPNPSLHSSQDGRPWRRLERFRCWISIFSPFVPFKLPTASSRLSTARACFRSYTLEMLTNE